MSRRRWMKWAVALIVVGLLAVGLTALAASTAGADAKANLVVHEWGTFTSFSGANGVGLPFHATDEDLPDFVYRSPRMKNEDATLVSLETPVLYFYADRPLTASVDVVFPRGRMTEWYPQTSKAPRSWLRYDGLRILPGASVDLPVQSGPSDRQIQTSGGAASSVPTSRYYAAREVDAAPIQVETTTQQPAADSLAFLSRLRRTLQIPEPVEKRTEHEKFIFYRGVGAIAMPLAITARGNGKVEIKNTGKEAVPRCVLVHVEGGIIRYREIGPLTVGARVSAELPQITSVAEPLSAVLVRALAEAGLFEKEARAMVKTWESAWFGEDGLRLLYIVPPALTEETLPLRIQPQPTALVRVLVGRHDFLTPEREQEIRRQVERLEGELADAERADIEKELSKLGRFQVPARAAARPAAAIAQ